MAKLRQISEACGLSINAVSEMAGQRSGTMRSSLLDDPLSAAEAVLVGGDFAVDTTLAHAKT